MCVHQCAHLMFSIGLETAPESTDILTTIVAGPTVSTLLLRPGLEGLPIPPVLALPPASNVDFD